MIISKKRMIYLGAILFCLIGKHQPLYSTDISWISTLSSDWGTSANWLPADVPESAAYNVPLTNAARVKKILLVQNYAIGGLLDRGTLSDDVHDGRIRGDG